MTDEQKALALACECAGRKMHHYALMGDDLPLRWSIEAHADTIMHYEALQAERDAQAAEIARLRETLGRIACLEGVGGPDASLQCADMAIAALAQETQP
jgi:NifU-like protein involved in Fe-S cluster formation